MKYFFVQAHSKRYPTTVLCRMLHVKRSSYYDWYKRPAKIVDESELCLRRRMKELFQTFRQSLGSRTMSEQLQLEGFRIGRDRTRRLMKSLNLVVKSKRKLKSRPTAVTLTR